MALSKDEVQLLKEMIADDSISKQEKDMYRDMLGDTPATASKPADKKATKKKSTPKKKKVSESDIDKMKAQIKQRTGKTEEECEKIVDEYRALRKKATTRKKKETATKEKSKQRTTKLKKEGKVIEGTTEKNVEATIDTATKTATKKVDKEITKIEKSTKGEKQVEKKIDQLVKKALASSKKFVSDMAKELSTKSKTDGKTYLLGLRSQIDALLKKYELGGEVFDGSGDSINFGGGGYTQPMDIQASLIMQGNNTNFEEGGKINTFNSEKDYENYLRKEGKPFDSVVIDKEEFIQDFYDRSGNTMTYRSKYGNQLEIENEDRYENGFGDSNVFINDGMYTPFDEEGNFAKGGTLQPKDEGVFALFRNSRETKDNSLPMISVMVGGKWKNVATDDVQAIYNVDGKGDDFEYYVNLEGVDVIEKGEDYEFTFANDEAQNKAYPKRITMFRKYRDSYAKGGRIEFRKLAKSKNFDIIVEEGRFEIELDKDGIGKYIVDSKGYRKDINKSPIAQKYQKQIEKHIGDIFFDRDDIEYAKGGKTKKKMWLAKESGGEEFVLEAPNKKEAEEDASMYGGYIVREIKNFKKNPDGSVEYAKGGMSQGYNDRLDESLGSRRGTSMSHHQNYKDRRDESKGMETGMGRRAYRGVNTMDNN